MNKSGARTKLKEESQYVPLDIYDGLEAEKKGGKSQLEDSEKLDSSGYVVDTEDIPLGASQSKYYADPSFTLNPQEGGGEEKKKGEGEKAKKKNSYLYVDEQGTVDDFKDYSSNYLEGVDESNQSSNYFTEDLDSGSDGEEEVIDRNLSSSASSDSAHCA